jgi:hypothetical protein
MDDAAIAGELAAIGERLQALAAEPASPGLGEELGSIRGDLRRLALENDEVGRRLGEQLSLRSPSDLVEMQ